ncbi:MAG: DsbA family protein [Candidatus Eremiobacteraeota bacterium]|nr:DsbA family protein [Candidatus Eremiobacteraeota bacterium]
MQTVEVFYYLDILSSWCFVADRALVRLREKYGEQISVDWRLAVSHEGQPFGYTREQMAGFYARTNAVTGVQLNPDWVEPGHEVSSAHACSAAEAARSLGVGDDRVRKGLAYAAMIEGAHVSRREVALKLAAELSGLDAGGLDRAMDDAAVVDRTAAATREFKELGATVRPTFVMTNSIGDRVVLSGIWAYEPLDAVIGELLRDAEAYERFNASS